MSFTSAAFQVHTIYQTIFPAPYCIDAKLHRIVANPNFNRKYFLIFRWILITTYTLFPPVLLFRLFSLFMNWSNEGQQFDEVALHIIFLCLYVILNYNMYVMLRDDEGFDYILSQCCKLEFVDGTFNQPRLHQFRKRTIKEILIYNLVASHPILCMTMFFIPFVLEWDIMQIYLGRSWYTKIIASLCYGIGNAYAGWLFVSTITLYISFLEILQSYTNKIIPNNLSLASFSNRFVSLQKFGLCYKRFRNTHMIFRSFEAVSDFFIVLIFVGTLLVSVSGYAMISMRKDLNVIIFLMTPTILVVCYSIAIVMTKYADIPRKNANLFKQVWSLHVRSILGHKQLQACPLIGFKLGPYGVVKAKLGLTLCDEFTRNIVSLLILF